MGIINSNHGPRSFIFPGLSKITEMSSDITARSWDVMEVSCWLNGCGFISGNIVRLLVVRWLVVWNIFYFPIYWECHHPNWRSYFSEGFKPPTRDKKNGDFSWHGDWMDICFGGFRFVMTGYTEFHHPAIERWDFPSKKYLTGYWGSPFVGNPHIVYILMGSNGDN